MAKYRKKPIVVEAYQFWRDEYFFNKPENLPRGLFVDEFSVGGAKGTIRNRAGFYVNTIHNQKTYLSDGDWIVAEPDGEHFYPCKPDIFEQTYEKVED